MRVHLKTSLLRRLWATFACYVIGFYASCINRFTTRGAENIPRQGGVLLASNHISGYETVFLPWAVIRRYPLQMVWAPAKEELFRNPFLGWLFRSWGAFPVKRGRDVRAGKALSELLQTEKVMLFPEGTRNRDGVLGKGNRGVGKLIYDNRPTVVPTALSGLNYWKFPGIGQKGAVVFGPPLDFSDLFALEDCKETHLLIVERLMAAIATLLKDAPQTKNI
jgi:1-acyl-sn-glycerol-3-phosphate acyltransferase